MDWKKKQLYCKTLFFFTYYNVLPQLSPIIFFYLHQPSERQIVVGICAMMKKSKSKPMTEILERLCKFDYIDVVIFPEEVILEEPVENWPRCDCLISFHSKGKHHKLYFWKTFWVLFTNALKLLFVLRSLNLGLLYFLFS